ncbi:MAG: hypothetical protein Q4Q07_04600 [Tissierellia bacterium]|nr:hypothetical protein [Tissierellia bacterium]
MKRKGFIFPIVLFFIMLMFIGISFGFLILDSTILSSKGENISDKVTLESLLRTQFAGKNTVSLEKEILTIVLEKNYNGTYPYEPSFIMEPFPVKGTLFLWKDDTKGILKLETKEYEMESLFSFWFPEINNDEPYLIFQDISDEFKSRWMETREDPIIVPSNMENIILEIPKDKEIVLKQNGGSLDLYEVLWDEEENSFREVLSQRIKNGLIYIHNQGNLTMEGNVKIKGGVINKGFLKIIDEFFVEGIWWELGNSTGNSRVKGKVFLEGKSFSGDVQYDFLSLFRYGRYVSVLYHLEPISFKVTPHDYFSQ